MRCSPLIFVLLLSAPHFAQGQAQLESNRKAANHLCPAFTHQNVDEAISKASAAVIWQPDMAAGYFRLGQLYEMKKDLPKALLNYKMAIEATLISRGRAHASNGQYKEALADFGEAIRMTPDVTKKKETFGSNLTYLALFHRGLTYAEMDKYKEAFGDLAAATEWYPGFAEAHYNMGLLRNLLDETGAAVSHTAEALRLIREKLDTRAVTNDPELALKLKRDYKDASLSLGFFYQKLGQWAKAEEAYRGALRYSAGDSDLLHMLGNMMMKQRRVQDALPLLQQAVDSRADDAALLSDYASALIESRRLPEAKQLLERALSLDAENPSVHDRFGELYERMGQIDQARASYQLAFDYSDENDAAGREAREKKLRELTRGGDQRRRTVHDQ